MRLDGGDESMTGQCRFRPAISQYGAQVQEVNPGAGFRRKYDQPGSFTVDHEGLYRKMKTDHEKLQSNEVDDENFGADAGDSQYGCELHTYQRCQMAGYVEASVELRRRSKGGNVRSRIISHVAAVICTTLRSNKNSFLIVGTKNLQWTNCCFCIFHDYHA